MLWQSVDKQIGCIDMKIGYIDTKIGYIDTNIGYSDKKIGYIDMKIGYNNKLIPNILSTKFLELTVDSTLSCRIIIIIGSAAPGGPWPS